MHGGLQLGGQRGVGGVRKLAAGRHQNAGRHLVVLGLTDQIGGDVLGVGRVIGQDRDLGGPGFGVDAHPRADQALGRRDVDVARAGDHVNRRQFGAVGVDAAVRHQRHRLGPPDRPHLVDAEQPGGGQDRRMG